VIVTDRLINFMEFSLNSDDDSDSNINRSISSLNDLWRTEVHAPEILPYREELVEEIRILLVNQEREIEDKNKSAAEVFTASFYSMDIERVKYSLKRYLRARILKIESQLQAIISSEEMKDRLSMQELDFLGKLNKLTNDHFEESLLSKLQPKLQESIRDNEDMLRHSQPQVGEFVFCRVQVPGEGLETVFSQSRLIPGDVYIAQYSSVQKYVLNGQIDLI